MVYSNEAQSDPFPDVILPASNISRILQLAIPHETLYGAPSPIITRQGDTTDQGVLWKADGFRDSDVRRGILTSWHFVPEVYLS
jgi:hypothetical protein